MNRFDLAEFIADALDSHNGTDGTFVSAHVDSDPGSVWVEVSDTDTDGRAGRTFRLTIEEQP